MKINVETTVAAPIEQVWRAYTTPAEIKQWNAASDDWHTTAASVDLREGGAFSSRMEAKEAARILPLGSPSNLWEPTRSSPLITIPLKRSSWLELATPR
jgi:hypothetical protein